MAENGGDGQTPAQILEQKFLKAGPLERKAVLGPQLVQERLKQYAGRAPETPAPAPKPEGHSPVHDASDEGEMGENEEQIKIWKARKALEQAAREMK